MSDPPKDWDKELAKIDRAMARLPEPAADPGATTTTWLRVLLVLTLALAMPLWPYPKGCGVGLYAYLVAACIVVLAGVWAGISTWHRRRPIGHILAIVVLLWGLALVAAEVLPRIGYAKAAIRWTCG